MDRIVIECDPDLKIKVKLHCINKKIKLKDYITNLILNDLK